jgi:RNA 3'-terminal phosphate cyclase-like protein
MKIVKRGYLPEGGGHVHIIIPAIRKFNKFNLEEKGYIKRVRGTCAGSKISTSILNQVKDKVKARMLEYLPDVWIYTDYFKGEKSSLSSGYSLSLQAETTTGATITFDACYESGTPEQWAEKVVNSFLDELQNAGVISTNYQWFALTLMALSEKKTSSIKLGRISPFTVECLRSLKDTLGVVFEIEESAT